MKYEQVYENEWVNPVMRNYRMKCCKCSLVHVMDFKVIRQKGNRNKVLFRARRLGRPSR